MTGPRFLLLSRLQPNRTGLESQACNSSPARRDQSGLVAVDHCLGSVPQPQLGENPGDMGLDGALADEQTGAISALHGRGRAGSAPHVPVQSPGRAPARRGDDCRRNLDQQAREHRRDRAVPVRRGPDAEQELLRTRVLQQETGGAGAQRVKNVLIDIEGAMQHHHPGRIRAERDDPPGRPRPFIRGIRTSMSTTSGRDLAASLTAAIPPGPHRPPRGRAESRPASGYRRAPAPGHRRSGPGSSLARRQPGVHRESPAGPGARLQAAAQQLSSLGQALQAARPSPDGPLRPDEAAQPAVGESFSTVRSRPSSR